MDVTFLMVALESSYLLFIEIMNQKDHGCGLTGNVVASHAADPGSIPGRVNFLAGVFSRVFF